LYKIRYNKYSQKEYDDLDGSQKVFINKALERIETLGMKAGEGLKGNLAGCNKLKNKRMGLRIIFREISGEIEIIEIVAIGKRDKSEVYKLSAQRI